MRVTIVNSDNLNEYLTDYLTEQYRRKRPKRIKFGRGLSQRIVWVFRNGKAHMRRQWKHRWSSRQ